MRGPWVAKSLTLRAQKNQLVCIWALTESKADMEPGVWCHENLVFIESLLLRQNARITKCKLQNFAKNKVHSSF